LASLIAGTLEKRPDQRPAGGRELAQSLRAIGVDMAAAGPAWASPGGTEAGDLPSVTVTFSRGDPRHNPGE